MGIFSLKQGRETGSKMGPVSDLDALISEPVTFKLHGQIFSILPVTTEVMFRAMEKLAAIEGMRDGKSVSAEDLVKRYYDLFHAVCPEITMRHVEDMTQSQAMSLLQLVVDSVTGKAQAEIEKKKKEFLARSSPSVPSN